MEQDNKFVKSLVESAQKGNNSAFEQLFRLNCGRVFTLCCRLTADPQSAYYLTTKIFIQAFKDIGFARKDTSFTSWLAGITVYFSLKEMRDEKSGLNKLKSAKEETKISGNIFFEASNEPNLESSLSKLDFNSRLAVILKDIEEYSEEETLDIMGISSETLSAIILVSHESLLKDIENADDEDLLIDKLKQLNKKIQPGIDLWPGIFNGLKEIKETDSDESEESIVKNFGDFRSGKTKEKKEKVSVKKPKKIRLPKGKTKKPSKIFKDVLYVIVVAALAYGAYYFIFRAKNYWDVTALKGEPKINVVAVENHARLESNEVLNMDSTSEAEIDIDNLGKIKVFPFTHLQKLPGINYAVMHSGKISFLRTDDKSIFKLKLPFGELVDSSQGMSYDVEINSTGDATISVNKGYVWVYNKNHEFAVPANYICDGVKEQVLGIPYYFTTDKSMRVNLSYYNSSDSKATIFGEILQNSTAKDAASLWNLFPVVSRTDRYKLYDKLASFVSPPNDVDKAEIIELNKVMLISWLKKILIMLS